MDADFSHNPNDLPRLYQACSEQGGDVSIGSRYVSGVNVVNWPMGRVLMSYFASKYVRFITGIPVHDVEPLPWRHFLQLRYSYQYRVNNSDRFVYDWDKELEEFAPDFDEESSNRFENQSTRNKRTNTDFSS